MLPAHPLDQGTPEEDIAAFVDAVKRSPDRRDALVALLPERNSLYTGRSTNATIRIRGYILAAFEQVGLPEAALPYVLEELESGRDAYVVAAAAKALRGLDSPPDPAIPLLFRAVENIKYVDDALTFEHYRPRWPLPHRTTALEEILKTFAWLGGRAQSALSGLDALVADRDSFSAATRTAIAQAIDAIRADGNGSVAPCGCCTAPASLDQAGEPLPSGQPPASSCCAAPGGPGAPAGGAQAERHDAAVPTDIEFEDQDGRTVTYGDFFCGKPAIVTFFYSRCDNPNKCSLTISKLARLQHAIRKEGLQGQLKTAAITYDPEYDLPPRLTAYGQNRGVVFGEDDRFLRARTEFEALSTYFALGVNFGQAIVNRHRIELFVLDDAGNVASTFARRQWEVDDVLHHAKALLAPCCGDSELHVMVPVATLTDVSTDAGHHP